MSECEAITKRWKNRVMYACERCNVRTLSADTLAARCAVTTTAPPIVSDLLGPDGESALIEPIEVGGGWYELPSGERVQGRDAAREAMGQPTSHDE